MGLLNRREQRSFGSISKKGNEKGISSVLVFVLTPDNSKSKTLTPDKFVGSIAIKCWLMANIDLEILLCS